MKKKPFLFCMLFFSLCISDYLSAQKTGQSRLDSLLGQLPKANEDTGKVNLFAAIISAYTSINPEEGIKYEKPALELAEKINWKAGIALVKRKSGRLYYRSGNFEEALKRHFEALSISEQLKDTSNISGTLTLIGQDYADRGNYTEAVTYFSKSLKISEASGNLRGQAYVLSLLSWVYTNQGNLPEATKSNLASLQLYEQLDDSHGIAVATSNIAGYYMQMSNYSEARKYYQKSIGAFKAIGDNLNLASLYIDFGRMEEATGNPTEALQYFNMSMQLGRQINNGYTIAFAEHNIGDWHKRRGNCSDALKYYLTAAKSYRAISNKQVLADLLCSAGACYIRLKKFKEANDCFIEALKLSNELGSPLVFSGYYGSREILDSAMGDWKDAYFNYKLHIQIRDSINSDESNKKSLQLNMQYEFDKKEAAAKAEQEKKDIRQRNVRNSITGVLAGSLIFLMVVYRQRNKISKARKRSDELLLNILPGEVAEELKHKGSADARHFDKVTVMFTDFKGFTQISEKLSPTELVNEIHTCFKAFDNIISNHNIEKIKTIGDSYMCAGGLPVANKTNAVDVVKAALEIQQFMQQHLSERKNSGKEIFEIRIGIHTGAVVAGIVGVKKFAYDIWGDTVNIASRMESSGEAAKVNISAVTYELVKDKFKCIHRGKIQAKNKGEIDMYFVEAVA